MRRQNAKKKDRSNHKKKQGWKIWSITGLLLLAAALVLVLYNTEESRRAGERSAKVLEELEHQIPDSGDRDSSQKNDVISESGSILSGSVAVDQDDPDTEDREMPAIEIDGYRYIGYIECPSIHLKLPVMDKWDYHRLKISPCRYSGSVYKNDLVIAGHNYAKHFSPLRWQQIGTKIYFTDAEGIRYSYEISDIEVLDPTNVREMTEKSNDWDLTLFTCTIGGQSRYTIRCVRTDRSKD